MKLPLSLIRSFIAIDMPIAEIGETLTLLGLEVDRVLNANLSFSGVVSCEVLSVDLHPHADQLRIAKVSDGVDTFEVVCGAANCRAKIKTALAKVGARLTDSKGHQRTIQASVLRGVSSTGMLCSEVELGVSDRGEGIVELPNDIELGKDLASFFWDPIFEISLTPNLGHCMSALGIARELSASLKIPVVRPPVALTANAKALLKDQIRVKIDEPRFVPRYMCRLIRGVSIAPSPFWLQRQLLACGLNPICNVVDIANYILFKVGQPLHVFDYDQIQGNLLQVARSSMTQPFLGLDGVEREIPPGTLLISDQNRPLAIAGILGGENSAVSDQTRNILIEAAVFDAKVIRESMKKLALRTDSAQRFEKGVDVNGTGKALDEACALILELCGGSLAEGVIDQIGHPFSQTVISLRAKRVDQILGKHFSLTELEEILRRLECSTKECDGGMLQVTVPSFRMDLSEEIDLIEEVARIYGYNNLERKPARCINAKIPHDPMYLFEQRIRTRLVGLGLQEFLTSNLIGPQLAMLGQEWVQKGSSLLKVLYAKTEEHSILRPSLLPGLMQAAKNNFGHRTLSFSAFEIGHIHLLEHEQLVEQPMAAILLTGKVGHAHWSRKSDDVDFFDLKGVVENLFNGMGISSPSFAPSSHLSFHPGRQAEIIYQERVVGSIGEVHPKLIKTFDMKQRLFYAELNLSYMMQMQEHHRRMQLISPFPSSERDWTLPLSGHTLVKTVFTAIGSISLPFLEKVELIDVYQPETQQMRNITFRFTYRDLFKTISSEEVDTQHRLLIEQVSKLLAK